VIEEEIIGPGGKKIFVQKRIIKEKDGTTVTEEVTTDENGNRVVKR